ncbi:MAG TPA: glycine betaine ABC transporter substrate-binding protein, partial [Burkholderiales bacterium]|nr:glycine betaine ABC transporter substrate-binding protein [Burkholderiales bacterium]
MLLCVLTAPAVRADELVVGSKRFTESYILGEIAAQTVRAAGEGSVTHAQGLGNTAILFEALKSGSIHLYPDYTGTVGRELLKSEATDLDALNRGLAPLGLGVAVRLGFNNTYALAALDTLAVERGLRGIGDLAGHPDLRFGLSHEFLNRNDGWPGLKRAYALPHRPGGLDHGLAYEAIAAGQIDVMDIYSTDAKIERYKLRVLADDKAYFPEYQALFVYRLDVPQRFPKAWAALARLEGAIDEPRMIAMNAAAELDAKPFSAVAAEFLAGEGAKPVATRQGLAARLFGPDLWKLTAQHLMLVFLSLAFAVAVGVPLGIWAARRPGAAQPILSAVGLIQTVPSLALL